MIFNQIDSVALWNTRKQNKITVILIQGKRVIYFKYFCRMAEVIYSVILHIVKRTIVKRVILTGFLELGKALRHDSLLSGCRSYTEINLLTRSEPEKMEAETIHVPLLILKMGLPSFVLIRNLLKRPPLPGNF